MCARNALRPVGPPNDLAAQFTPKPSLRVYASQDCPLHQLKKFIAGVFVAVLECVALQNSNVLAMLVLHSLYWCILLFIYFGEINQK
jgi:hypothetical protein